MRVELIGHFKPRVTDIYLQITFTRTRIRRAVAESEGVVVAWQITKWKAMMDSTVETVQQQMKQVLEGSQKKIARLESKLAAATATAAATTTTAATAASTATAQAAPSAGTAA